ncbi:MAG: FecR family protein [Bacteroidota bacterium]
MKTKNSIEQPDWSLIGKYLLGETNATETKKVEQWAAASEKNQKELEAHRGLISKTDKFFGIKNYNTDNAWNNVLQKLTPSEKTSPFIIFRKKTTAAVYKYAAILLLALLIGSAGYYLVNNQMNPTHAEVISAENQWVKEVILPDGSTVALNSNSRLEYSKKFDEKVREVTVTGEAFFDVAPDPDRPFIINAGDARVKVLGTSFNVNAYPAAESVEVIVETGIVQVVCCEDEDTGETVELLLNAGEKGTLNNSSKKLEKTRNTDPNYLAWKTHNLLFERTRLSEVIKHLNKIYHIDVHLETKELEDLMLTAEFEEKSADFILDVIRLTFDLDLKQENGVYILSGNTTLNK